MVDKKPETNDDAKPSDEAVQAEAASREETTAKQSDDDKTTDAPKKVSPWPSPSEALGMLGKLAKDMKKSGEEIYHTYKTTREQAAPPKETKGKKTQDDK